MTSKAINDANAPLLPSGPVGIFFFAYDAYHNCSSWFAGKGHRLYARKCGNTESSLLFVLATKQMDRCPPFQTDKTSQETAAATTRTKLTKIGFYWNSLCLSNCRRGVSYKITQQCCWCYKATSCFPLCTLMAAFQLLCFPAMGMPTPRQSICSRLWTGLVDQYMHWLRTGMSTGGREQSICLISLYRPLCTTLWVRH